ncbi:hypothetical protein HDU79_001429, partial [Rhizoclosmatium sp. JEL0117]
MSETKDLDEKGKYPVFNGANLPVWGKRMCILLDSKGVTGLKDGTFIEPVTTDATKLAEWRKLNGLAKECLIRFLSDDVLMSIDETKTAQEIWNQLQTMYGGKDWVTRVTLQQEFFAEKCEGARDVEPFLN